MTAACGDQFPISAWRPQNGSTKMEEAGEISFESSQSQARKRFRLKPPASEDFGVLMQSEPTGSLVSVRMFVARFSRYPDALASKNPRETLSPQALRAAIQYHSRSAADNKLRSVRCCKALL